MMLQTLVWLGVLVVIALLRGHLSKQAVYDARGAVYLVVHRESPIGRIMAEGGEVFSTAPRYDPDRFDTVKAAEARRAPHPDTLIIVRATLPLWPRRDHNGKHMWRITSC